MRPINFSLQQLSLMLLLYHIILFFTNTPFSVHVRMEGRLSDRGAPVAQATTSFHYIH
jgi:hypothetical protein